MDLKPGSNLCKQLLLRENYFRRDSWHYQAAIYRERLLFAKSLCQRNLHGHWGCVNALEFSNGGEYLASGGDDKRVLIWNVEKAVSNIGQPVAMRGEHQSNIFCLGFDNSNVTVYSGGNDEAMLRHDFETGKTLNYFVHLSPIYGLSVDKTSNNLVSTATEDGDLLVHDMRAPESDPLVLARFGMPFNAVEFHPLNGNYLISANSTRGALLWDMRSYDEPVIHYNYLSEYPSCMSVRFNATGTHILTLHRRLPPILYSTNSKEPVCTFYHKDYFNSCTMKSCSFAGPDDELVLSGSDDFNLYVWRLKDVDLNDTCQWTDTADMVLYGHRSIVNQVRYNRQRCLIASSGVEKLIKLWSPFKQKDWSGDIYTGPNKPPKTRDLYAHNSMSEISQEFNNRNNEEDPHMLAFFDTLVQRELIDWETDSSNFSVEIRSVFQEGFSANESDSSGGPNQNDTSTNESPSDPSLLGFPNRISYLISRKQRSLLRLAIKGSTSTSGKIPHRLRTHSPIRSTNFMQSPPFNFDTPASSSNRNGLYSSPTRMQCWLEGFETETYNINSIEERATTSAAALGRAGQPAMTANPAYRVPYFLMMDSSTETTNSFSDSDDLNINNNASTYPSLNGFTTSLVEGEVQQQQQQQQQQEAQQQQRPRKRKFCHKKKQTNLYAKRSRSSSDIDDDDDSINSEDGENEVMLSQTTNNTNSDNNDDDDDNEHVQHDANLTSNESDNSDDIEDDVEDTENQSDHGVIECVSASSIDSSSISGITNQDECTERNDVDSDDENDYDTNDNEIDYESKNGDTEAFT